MTTKIEDFLPPPFKVTNSQSDKKLLLPALYAAIDNESAVFENMSLEAFRQLFLVTASGKYLIRLGAQEGFTVPQQSGLGVDAFRSIVPAVVSYPKQISETMVRLISIFYNKSLVSPSIISTLAEPFSFQDKDTLLIKTDKGVLSIGIYDGQVADLNNVKASEYASVINAAQSDVFADTSYERETTKTYIRLTSKTSGAGAFIQIVGGTAQNALQFPNIAKTLNGTGTTWTVEKKNHVLWTDITTFTWDGTGTNPRIYLVNIGDYVTIKGQTAPFDVFNGTFVVEDCGYDYFSIRNERYQLATGTMIENANNNMVFTVDKRSTILQNKEYCLASEATDSEYSLFVSAVPSVVKRNLRGGGFVHGWQAPVVSFNRNEIVVKTKTMESIPNGENQFVLQGEYFRADYTKKYYKTLAVSAGSLTASFLVDSISPNISVLPFTSSVPIGVDTPFYGELKSSEVKLKFAYYHGMQHGVGFTLENVDVAGMMSSSIINREQVCKKVLSPTEISFVLDYGKTTFPGIPWGGNPDVYQAMPNTNGYDFYLLFPDTVSKANAGFEDKMTFRITYDGADLVAGKESIGISLSSQKCEVVSQDDLRVYFRAGIGAGINGKVLETVVGVRSGWFGGFLGTQYVDLTSAQNTKKFSNMLCTFQETSSSLNSAYVGPFIYDTTGAKTKFVVGNILTSLKTHILKGGNLLSIDVDDSASFPLSGSLIFDYGTDSEEGPVKYINLAVGQIIIDPSYVFAKEHVVGGQVQIVRDNVSAPSLSIDGSQYPCYVTGTALAREFLFTLIRQIVAAGVFVNAEVNYPPLKFTDPCLFPYA